MTRAAKSLIRGLTPDEYAQPAQQAIIDHLLMKEVFHCTPDTLAGMDHSEVMLHWEIREAIRKEEQAQSEKHRYNTKRAV